MIRVRGRFLWTALMARRFGKPGITDEHVVNRRFPYPDEMPATGISAPGTLSQLLSGPDQAIAYDSKSAGQSSL